MTAPTPQLSVIIACLNGASTLDLQLRALAAQPCPVEWELVFCDNGSTDASVAIAESYRTRLPHLLIVDASAHPGVAAARNYGVARSHGEWIAFCDADDVVADDWLARMCEALTEHRFVAGRFDAELLNSPLVRRSRPLDQQDGLQTSDFGPRLPHAGGGNLGIHRADFLAVGGFDTTIRCLEDTDFSWRAQLAGIPLEFRKDLVVHVRLRSSFRSMYHQGVQYGRAYALLEERYAAPSAERPVAPSRWQRVADSLVDHLLAGRLAWRVGWIAGHRGWAERRS